MSSDLKHAHRLSPAAARSIWRRQRKYPRGGRSRGTPLYLTYLTLMLTITAGLPLCFGLWIIASAPQSQAFVTRVFAAVHPVIGLGTAAFVCCAAALVIGSVRGPAIEAPFLTTVLATSAIPREKSLRRPVLRSTLWTVGGFTFTAVFLARAFTAAGVIAPAAAPWLVLTFACCGVIAVWCALVGQAFPRAAGWIAFALTSVAVLSAVLAPVLSEVLPVAGPLTGSAYFSAAHFSAACFASACYISTPALLRQLRVTVLQTQAVRWAAALGFVTTMDVSLVAETYRTVPQRGRRWRAVTPHRSLLVLVARRDAVGLTRTPARLAASVIIIIGAALACMAVGTGAHRSSWLAILTLVVFFACGPLAQGAIHAVRAAQDHPLYGVSDAHLVGLHTALPLTVISVIMLSTVGIGGVALGALALALRLCAGLKGPMPPRLMTPMVSDAGDLSVGLRIGWLLTEPLLAVAAGYALATGSLIAASCTVATVSALLVFRWKGRRGQP